MFAIAFNNPPQIKNKKMGRLKQVTRGPRLLRLRHPQGPKDTWSRGTQSHGSSEDKLAKCWIRGMQSHGSSEDKLAKCWICGLPPWKRAEEDELKRRKKGRRRRK